MSGPFDLLRAARDLALPPPPPKLTATDKLVLVALVMRSNAERSCWPSHARLAADTWLSKRAVKDSLSRLKEAGIIDVQRRTCGETSEADSNLYRVRIEVVQQTPQVGQQAPHLGNEAPHGEAAGAPGVGQQLPQGGAPAAPEVLREVPKGSTQGRTAESAAPAATPPRPSKRRPETPAPASDATPEVVDAWCATWGIPSPKVDREALALINHARTHDRRVRDWSAAWRMWLSKAPLFGPTRGPGGQPVDESAPWLRPEGT